MSRRRSKALILTAMSAAVMVGSTAFSASAVAAPRDPCPKGYACLYDGASYTKYGKYGSHNLHGVTGTHYFFNAQTGNAKAYLCTDYNGNGTCYYVAAGTGVSRDFRPIYSIYLSPA